MDYKVATKGEVIWTFVGSLIVGVSVLLVVLGLCLGWKM